jgi:hypothetical protein
MNLYKHLKNIPPQGVWAFVNNRNKKMYISYNVDVLGAVAHHIKMMHRKEHPISDLNKHKNILKFVMIDSNPLDDESSRLHLAYWSAKYEKMGYRMYRERSRLKYSVGYDIHDRKVVVFLKNARNEKTIVGVFPQLFQASQFIENCYTGKDILFPVYAFNRNTKEYVEREDD